jgi:hypothetical protein
MRSFEGDSRRTAIDDLVASRTAAWTEQERESLGAVITALNPSARHLTDALDWLDEIAARDGARPAVALDDSDLQAAIRARGSAPDRLKRWKARLRRMRFPRLAARETEVASAINALDLGNAATVIPPPDLEGGVLTVALRARSSGELAAAVERLRTSVTRGAFDRVFALLDEL